MFNKKIRNWLFRLVVLAACLVILFSIVNFKKVFIVIAGISLWTIGAAVGLGLVRAWLLGIRWKWLTPGGEQLKTRQYFSYIMISCVYSVFVPGLVGNDIVRSVMVYRSCGKSRGKNILSVWADRAVGFQSIILMGLFVCLFVGGLPNRENYLILILILQTGIFLGIIVLINRKIFKILNHFLPRMGCLGHWAGKMLNILEETLIYYTKNPVCLIKSFLICFLIHFCSFLITYLLAHSLGIMISFSDVIVVMTIMWLVTAIPVSISGLGIRELGFVFLLAPFGVNADSATALSLCHFGIGILLGIAGLPFLIYYLHHKPEKTLEKDVEPASL